MSYQNLIRLQLAESFNEFEDVFVVDSMPLEICKKRKRYDYQYKEYKILSTG